MDRNLWKSAADKQPSLAKLFVIYRFRGRVVNADTTFVLD